MHLIDKRHVGVMLITMLALLAAVAPAGASGASKEVTYVDYTDVLVYGIPCTGEVAEVAVHVTGTIRTITRPKGGLHEVGDLEARIEYTVLGDSEPTYFGHDSVHYVENANRSTYVYNDIFTIRVYGPDGFAGRVKLGFHQLLTDDAHIVFTDVTTGDCATP